LPGSLFYIIWSSFGRFLAHNIPRAKGTRGCDYLARCLILIEVMPNGRHYAAGWGYAFDRSASNSCWDTGKLHVKSGKILSFKPTFLDVPN